MQPECALGGWEHIPPVAPCVTAELAGRMLENVGIVLCLYCVLCVQCVLGALHGAVKYGFMPPVWLWTVARVVNENVVRARVCLLYVLSVWILFCFCFVCLLFEA